MNVNEFDPMAGVVAAGGGGLPPGTYEGAFQAALKGTVRFRIAGDRLELLDASGARVAAFVPGSQGASPQIR